MYSVLVCVCGKTVMSQRARRAFSMPHRSFDAGLDSPTTLCYCEREQEEKLYCARRCACSFPEHIGLSGRGGRGTDILNMYLVFMQESIYPVDYFMSKNKKSGFIVFLNSLSCGPGIVPVLH